MASVVEAVEEREQRKVRIITEAVEELARLAMSSSTTDGIGQAQLTGETCPSEFGETHGRESS